jgi:DNA-binding CsgD family transcriptional regulator/energy-coupling factor transporter ATP-binding protein EcfA2
VTLAEQDGAGRSNRTGAAVLLERERQLERLRQSIAAAVAGTGGVVLIEGPAGIGKTALLQAARGIGQDAGMQVLRARSSDLEQEFAVGVVRQLFEGLLARADDGERPALFSGAAALAGPLFDLAPAAAAAHHVERPGAVADARGGRPASDLSFTLVHGLYWLTANLAEHEAVMIAVDDAHWADLSSLQFLAYLGARCAELGVLVALTAREGEPTAARQVIGALRNEPGAVLLAPESLSDDAVASLVRSSLGQRADPTFCAACAHASAGNPFLLHELIAELEAERIEPLAASAARVEGVWPGSVSHAVVARLVRLGGDASTLARAVAVLESASLRQAAALAGIDQDRAGEAADGLISAQILTSTAPLRFIHPLLRRAVYEGILPATRADSHRRAGLLLAAEGTRSTLAAAHLLRSEPADDPAVVAALRQAAREALGDGAPPSAVRLLRRALSEPPPDQLRGAVLGELGEAEALARDPAAVRHLAQALELTDDPVTRVRLASQLGSLLVWVGQPLEAHSVVGHTIDSLPEGAPAALRAALETVRVATASVDRRLVADVAPRLPALHELALAAGPAGNALLIFEGCWRAQSGPYSGGWRELIDRGLDDGRFVAAHTAGSPIVSYATAVLVLADEVARAEALIADIRDDARARGSIDAHLTALTWGSLLALRRGDPTQAEGDARTTLELANRHEVPWTRIWSTAFLVGALLERGELEEADQALARSGLEDALGSAATLHALLARGRLRLAQGRRAEAIDDLRATGRSVIVNNPSYVPWRSALALALALSGDDPEEARLLAEGELLRARELGQPRGIGVALRAGGILAGGGSGIALLTEAVQALRASPAALELARALCDLGAARRRAGQRTAAREPLREALELAQRCGAAPLAQRAREELLATGAHPRRERLSGPQALTPSERRVAEMAAGRFTNRQIAEALFVTAKTVGTHLGHIYRKLDLDGPHAREQIGQRLGSDAAQSEPRSG